MVSPVEYRQGLGLHLHLHLCSRHLLDFQYPVFPPTAGLSGVLTSDGAGGGGGSVFPAAVSASCGRGRHDFSASVCSWGAVCTPRAVVLNEGGARPDGTFGSFWGRFLIVTTGGTGGRVLLAPSQQRPGLMLTGPHPVSVIPRLRSAGLDRWLLLL